MITTPRSPAAHCLPSGATGLCALALLRKFERWQIAAINPADPDCEFLNGTAWKELEKIGDDARMLFAQIDGGTIG